MKDIVLKGEEGERLFRKIAEEARDQARHAAVCAPLHRKTPEELIASIDIDAIIAPFLAQARDDDEEDEDEPEEGDDDPDEFDEERPGRWDDGNDGPLADGTSFADPGGRSALRAATRTNPRNLPCPECSTPNVLTPADVACGYRCDRCAERAEGGGW